MLKVDLFTPGREGDSCACKRQGVIVDGSGRFQFCSCNDGARERGHDVSGFAKHIGKTAREVMSELKKQLKGEECTLKTSVSNTH